MTLPNTRLDRRQLLAALGLSGFATLAGHSMMTAQHSPFATPTGSDQPPDNAAEPGDRPFANLLAMVPVAALEAGFSGAIPWSYDDLARQFAAFGMHHDLGGPDIENEPVLLPTSALAGASTVMLYAMDDEFTTAIGFKPLGLDRTLYAGEPPSQVQLFQAPFDLDALEAAWTASGYQPVETASGIPAWTIGPDGEFAPTNPIQRRAIAALNNLAVVGDVIVATNTLARLETVLNFPEAGGESLLDDPAIGPMVSTMPVTIVSAMALRPTAIEAFPIEGDGRVTQAEELEAIRSEVGPMPPALGAIVAVEEGAMMIDSDWSPDGTPVATPRPDAGTAFLHLNMATLADAQQALPVITERWQRLQSTVSHLAYTEIMELVAGTTIGTIVELEFRQMLQPRTWLQLVMTRDLLPLAPDAG